MIVLAVVGLFIRVHNFWGGKFGVGLYIVKWGGWSIGVDFIGYLSGGGW